MLSFLSGVGVTFGLLLVFGAGYLTSKRNTPKALTRPPTDIDELEEQRRKQQKIQRDFTTMWQYDVAQAYEGKDVN